MTFLYLILLTNVTKNKCNSTIWLNPLLQPTYQTTKTAFFHLRNIARLCPSLPFSAAETLTHAFSTSRLDYRSSLIRGSSSKTLKKLQYSQNPAARLLRHSRTRDHITLVLHNRLWLPHPTAYSLSSSAHSHQHSQVC